MLTRLACFGQAAPLPGLLPQGQLLGLIFCKNLSPVRRRTPHPLGLLAVPTPRDGNNKAK